MSASFLPTDREPANAAVVRAFVTRINAGEIDAAAAFLAPDIFYHNIPMQPMSGRDAVRAFIEDFGVGTRFVADWEMVALAVEGDVVLTERIDRFRQADGRTIVMPLMGSFRVRGGLITEWRDYFDLAEFNRQLAEISSPAAVTL